MRWEKDDKYIHAQPCGCCHCDMIRVNRHVGPGLYKAIEGEARFGGRDGRTTTWTLDRMVWGEKIAPGELIYVVRDLEPTEPGGQRGYLDGVLIIPLDGKPGRFSRLHLCTSKRWIEPA